MSKPKDFYCSGDMARTIQQIQEYSLKSSGEKFGCIHPPLIKLQPCNIVPDELHLLLRMTGIVLIFVLLISWPHMDFVF